MRRDEILAMPAGEEFDELVAEKIMPEKCGYARYGKFNPSVDIADAWEVVEHFADKGYCPALLFDDNGHWALSFEGAQSVAYGDEPMDVSTTFFITKDLWCDTAPLAICRTALLAVMQ